LPIAFSSSMPKDAPASSAASARWATRKPSSSPCSNRFSIVFSITTRRSTRSSWMSSSSSLATSPPAAIVAIDSSPTRCSNFSDPKSTVKNIEKSTPSWSTPALPCRS